MVPEVEVLDFISLQMFPGILCCDEPKICEF